MSGAGWKAIGTILIVVGGLTLVLGVAAAVFGGSLFAGAVEDAGSCGGLFDPCDERTEARGEAGIAIAAVGGLVGGVGLLVAIVGIVLVFVGASRARAATS